MILKLSHLSTKLKLKSKIELKFGRGIDFGFLMPLNYFEFI